MKKILKNIVFYASVISGFTFGLFVSYLIQFKWNFFGANFVAIDHILIVWIVPCILFSSLGVVFGCYVVDKM